MPVKLFVIPVLLLNEYKGWVIIKAILFFLGGMLAVLFVALIIYYAARRKIRSWLGRFSGIASVGSLMSSFRSMEQEEEPPKSLGGADTIYLPEILKDFPDFNSSAAKNKVKEKLKQLLSGKNQIRIHNVVISGYTRTTVERTIIYQAALEYRKNGKLIQKRYCLHYSFVLRDDKGESIAANCPNCGGAISATNQTVCEYCDSRIVNVLGNTWTFTDIFEK